MKAVLIFFAIVILIVAVIAAERHDYLTPLEAEIMSMGLFFFGVWWVKITLEDKVA